MMQALLLLALAPLTATGAPGAGQAGAQAGRAGAAASALLAQGCMCLSSSQAGARRGALSRLRGGGGGAGAAAARTAEAAESTAHDVAKAMQLLEKARAGYAAAGVKPPGKLEQIDELNRMLAEDKDALIHGDRRVLERLEQKLGGPDPGVPAEEASVLDSEEQEQEDWEAGVDKLKEEGDAILEEIRTGKKRGPDYNHWDEIPALRKAELMITEDSHHALWKAVRDQNADRLAYLLQHRKQNGDTQYDVNHMFSTLWNSTLLHVAAECEDVEVATMLVTSGARMEQRNTYYQAPLHLATFWGNMPMVRRLLDMGAELEVRSSDDSTPLHIAAFYGQNETAKELVPSLPRRIGFCKVGVHVAHACCQSRPAHFACARARGVREHRHAFWLGGGCKGGQLCEGRRA